MNLIAGSIAVDPAGPENSSSMAKLMAGDASDGVGTHLLQMC
jgi:hypothetical protein